jgi:hypothetical protein
MEAEFMAAGDAVREALYLQWLRYFVQGKSGPIPMISDSDTSLKLIHNPVAEDMRKHVDVIYNHTCEREEAVSFSYIPGRDNVADMLTKALPRLSISLPFRSAACV